MSYYDEIASEIDKLLDENPPNWRQLETKFNQLQQRVGISDNNRDDYHQLRQRFDDRRREVFDEAYQQLEDDMPDLNNTEFDQRVKLLAELGGSNTYVDNQISDLKARRRNHRNINDFVGRVKKNLATFHAQIAAGMDSEAAVKAYLTPLKAEGERMVMEVGDNLTLNAVLEELRQAEKSANDQLAFTTMAALGEFEKVIASIQAKPETADIDLIAVGGVNQGRKKKRDALDWYEQRAREFEEKKADEYLTKARQELNDGHPIMANHIMRAAENLKRLSPPKEKEVRDFIAQHIAPIMERVKGARLKLAAVKTAKSLRDSITLFDEALDEKTGWPEFETMGRDKRRAKDFLQQKEDDNADDESGLVGDALKYIYETMEREFQYWQAQEEVFATGHKLYYTLNSKEIENIQFFIYWRDKRLMPVYGRPILALIERYNAQAQQIADLKEAYRQAMSAVNQQKYTHAYDLLEPYTKLLDVENERYKDIVALWDKLQGYVDIEKVRQEMKAILAQGILNPNDLQGDLNRLQANRDKAMAIVADPLTAEKAASVGLTRTAKDVAGLYNLVKGLHERNKGNLTEAKQAIQQAIQDFSSEYPEYKSYAEDILQDLNANIKDDQDLNAALDKAKIELDAGRVQAAYDALLPHEDKTASTRYGEFLNLMSIIRPKLTDELRERILELLDREPDDAGESELKWVAPRLEQANRMVYDTLKPRIIYMQAVYEALRQSKRAQELNNMNAWRNAVHAWGIVIADDNTYEYEYDFALENYVVLYMKDEFIRVPQANPDKLGDARQRVADVLVEIEKLSASRRNRLVPLLRLQVYAHILILEEDLRSLNSTIQRAENEAKLCSEDDRATTEYKQARRLVDRGTALYKAGMALVDAFTLEHTPDDWRKANTAWVDIVMQRDETNFIGMRVWEKAFFAQTCANLEAIIGASDVIWQQIDPTAKLILITGDINPRQIDSFYAMLQSVLNDVLNNYRGDYVPQGVGEVAYLNRLERATESLLDILKWNGVPASASYTVNGISAQLGKIQNKRTVLEEVYGAIQRGRGQLGAACASGEFGAVEAQIAVITAPTITITPDNSTKAPTTTPNAETATQTVFTVAEVDTEFPTTPQDTQTVTKVVPNPCYVYANHLAVKALINDMQRAQQERSRLQTIAGNAVIYAQREEFEQAIATLKLLGKAEKEFMAVRMVKYQDMMGAGEIVTNADIMFDLITDKHNVVQALLKWLEPIIPADKLMAIIRPDPNQLPATPAGVNFVGTNIVNFDLLEAQLVEYNRANKAYDHAHTQLERLAFGDTQHANDPATYYDNHYLSLKQAQNILRGVPVEKSDLNSVTATALFNWAVLLFNLLRDYLNYCEQLDAMLTQTEQQFDIEYDRFRKAYRELQQGTRDSKRYLEILHESYKRIRGDASGRLPATGRENNLYPLAHLWTGLDDDYKNYRNKR